MSSHPFPTKSLKFKKQLLEERTQEKGGKNPYGPRK